jgi:hypothetical protein
VVCGVPSPEVQHGLTSVREQGYQRGRFSVPIPAVMKTTVAVPSISADATEHGPVPTALTVGSSFAPMRGFGLVASPLPRHLVRPSRDFLTDGAVFVNQRNNLNPISNTAKMTKTTSHAACTVAMMGASPYFARAPRPSPTCCDFIHLRCEMFDCLNDTPKQVHGIPNIGMFPSSILSTPGSRIL